MGGQCPLVLLSSSPFFVLKCADFGPLIILSYIKLNVVYIILLIRMVAGGHQATLLRAAMVRGNK